MLRKATRAIVSAEKRYTFEEGARPVVSQARVGQGSVSRAQSRRSGECAPPRSRCPLLRRSIASGAATTHLIWCRAGKRAIFPPGRGSGSLCCPMRRPDLKAPLFSTHDLSSCKRENWDLAAPRARALILEHALLHILISQHVRMGGAIHRRPTHSHSILPHAPAPHAIRERPHRRG